ncbi:DUF2961 domain-containing protein [candidate division KSB1 bacterium]|nr:DUF2961 domain-containing protein [candidate division KSB1 bacterium]
MQQNFESSFGLGTVALLSNSVSRSICAENPTGEKGAGAKEIPDENNHASELGQGWKVRPCLTLEKDSLTTLAEIDGPGTITHIWITCDPKAYRNCIIRFYWDNEPEPSVETPLGDLFCNGHAMRCKINSLPIAVNPNGGFNSYFPMPFRKAAKITIENQMNEKLDGFFYQFDYSLGDIPANAAYFHAQWCRENTVKFKREYTILDGVKGKGQYVGTYMAWAQLSNGWWGEGEIKFYLDGDKQFPTICGTGTEDYFGGAWCFGDTYSTPFLGYPLWHKKEGEVTRHGLYRWHLMDPIRFEKELRVTMQDLGWNERGKLFPLTDDISSVAYWYQTEPHAAFPELPPAPERWPR